MTTLKPLHFENNRKSTDLTHSLFRFPGKFHPPLVVHLLELHPESRIIGDLMVGSGTVAVEAAAHKKVGIFSDIDPLSCLLTRAKSRPVDPDWLVKTIEMIIERGKPRAKSGIDSDDAQQSITDLEGSTQFRAPPNVFHWFQPHVIVNLCKTLREVAEIECSSRRRDAILAIFASAIRRLSRADPTTSSGLEVTKIRLEALQNGLTFDIAKELTRKAKLLAKGYRNISKISGRVKNDVIQHDARDWSVVCAKHNKWPDLVITSPCYLSAIEYWRRHKLEYSWIGLVPPKKLPDIKRTFLGMGKGDPDVDNLSNYTRRLYTKLSNTGYKRDANELARYFNDSSKWITELATVLNRTDGTAYIVLGSNTKRGILINTPKALEEIASSNGLCVSVFMRYRIKNSFMQYPTKGKRIKSETVLKITAN